jgi:hypothetical protein
VLRHTFEHFRECGEGRRECQVLWLSSWDEPQRICQIVHPAHSADMGGFELDDRGITELWLRLKRENMGIRVQVHTHPGPAFHSAVDDEYPIIHTLGFLSLVIPNFGLGPIGFDGAYLTEIQAGGSWLKAAINERLVVR